MTAPQTPIHLLHVLPSFAPGGTQRRVVALIDGLGDDFRHTVLALDGRREAALTVQRPDRLRFAEATVRPSRGIDFGNLARLRRLLRRERPDVLITYNWGAIEAGLANRFFPLCPHLHCEDGFAGAGASVPEPSRRAWLRRLVLVRGSRLVVPSSTLQALAKAQWKLPESAIIHLPNGVDAARFAAPARHRDDSDKVVIGTLARLSPEKNIHRLLRVFAVAAGRQALHLLIAGDGPERAALETAAEELKLGDRVTFLGQVDAPEAVLSRIEIFALTSDSEQMPLSVLEAMAASLPVVASDVGDIGEMVADENRFAIVPASDEAAFVDAVVAFARSAPLRQRVGAANAVRARERYDLEVMLTRYRRLLTETARHGD